MRFFLIGWFGAGNAGDEAILLAELIALGSQIEDAEFDVLSFDPVRTKILVSIVPGVRNIVRMGSKGKVVHSDLAGIWRSLREADVVVIGGGGLFQDIYNHYPIPFFTAMALAARLLKKPLILYALGIGPIRTAAGKRLCRLAANCAEMISVRDVRSRDILRELGITREIHLCADPAFMLTPVVTPKVEELLARIRGGGRGPLIGVCVQDLLSWDDGMRKVLAGVLDAVTAERGARTVFLPLGSYRNRWVDRGSADSMDAAAAKRVATAMEREFQILDEELLPSELLAVMREMNIIISMRFHGLVLGLTAGLPVIALTYAEESKLRELMRRIGEEESLFDVRRLDGGSLLARVCQLMDTSGQRKESHAGPVPGLRAEIGRFHGALVERLAILVPTTHGNRHHRGRTSAKAAIGS